MTRNLRLCAPTVWRQLITLALLGLGSATVAGSQALRDWLKSQSYAVTYEEVNADHAGMVPLVLPHVFTFFDQVD